MCVLKEEMLKSILVIDDDIDLLMLLERRLIREGYAVETAASLPQAEEILAAFIPSLILLDINVRGDDGRQLCYKLKSAPEFSRTHVLLMSGYDFSTGRARIFGADDLLPKPLNVDYLLHRMAQLWFPEAEAGPSLFPTREMDELE
jgi:DNA-binding response OmpR family regulator